MIELGRVAAFSSGVAKLPNLRALLGCREVVFRPSAAEARSLDAVIGWGHKPTADAARRYAASVRLPYVALEDGFLRSVGAGPSSPPLSLVVDDVGIYYDAREPSRLERLLGSDGGALADPDLLARARRCRRRIVEGDVSKYNQARAVLPPELRGGDRYVVIADQTFGDASVAQGLAEPETFRRMLDAALAEHPGSRIVLKVHPDTLSGRKRGYFDVRRPLPARVSVAGDVSPMTLLARASHAYVCTSQLGFEALLAGVPVTCFGAPFYAGWGLTDDRVAVPRRARARTLDELVLAALILYPRYVQPVTGEPCRAEDVIEHLALNRRIFAENDRRFVCFGFSRWKRPFVRRYLAAPGRRVTFVPSVERAADVAADPELTAVVWASRKTGAVASWAAERGAPLWHMEDGFLRSVGLGSDLTAPGSLVLDREGIYYDPRCASRLEQLLEGADFSPEELARAAALRARIVATGISKYNPVGGAPLALRAPPDKRVVLVPGQVDDDASVRLGGNAGVHDNAGLLRAVRAARPDAYVVYKPHPDVLSGNRAGAVAVDQVGLWDEVVEHVALSRCLDVVHEVHTLTSLVGFEALLRGLPVSTYGLPFYAGWGLTSDRCSCPRRTRRRSLDELCAAALLCYPRYFSWSSRSFCSAEDKVRELERLRSRRRLPARTPALVRRIVSLALSGVEWGRAWEWSHVR